MTPIKRTNRFLLSKIFCGGFQRKHPLTTLFVIKVFLWFWSFISKDLLGLQGERHDHPLPCLELATSLSSIKFPAFTQSFFWKI